ncbi:DUF1515 family protein [Mesorhizobium sp. WSM2239]|uniref:DUF1515 family protein n=2 Tax=unclassified Mesorhizobium TaxID=325217 RepID=A0AAU8DA73_9HYPH
MAGLNDIYRLLGELTATVKAVNEKVDDLKEDIAVSEESSTKSRANMHRRLDEVVLRTNNIETNLTGVKSKVESVSEITDDVKAMKNKAEGAGTLGHWLIKIGIGVVSLAGWVIGLYTYITGRPPP